MGSQALVSYLEDQFGDLREDLLLNLVALVTTGLTSLGYGLSRNFGSALTFQVLEGLLNSNMSMLGCIASELYPEKK